MQQWDTLNPYTVYNLAKETSFYLLDNIQSGFHLRPLPELQNAGKPPLATQFTNICSRLNIRKEF